MSSTAPTVPPTFSADQLTIIVASVSCLAFFLVILTLLTVLYRKDPLCCKGRSYRGPQHYTDPASQYHNSRQSLVGYPYDNNSTVFSQSTLGAQHPGGMFIIGKPSNYHLDGPLPRLPSYESVRKKDRQRQIHTMIAQRFGLNNPSAVSSELPPTYEETVRQSIDLSHLDVTSASTLPSITTPRDSRLIDDTHPMHQSCPSELQGPMSSLSPARSTSRGPVTV